MWTNVTRGQAGLRLACVGGLIAAVACGACTRAPSPTPEEPTLDVTSWTSASELYME